MNISVRINRSQSWVKAKRIATGENVPDAIDVAVNPAELSETTRARLINVRGEFLDIRAIEYGEQCVPCSFNPSSQLKHGNEQIFVDAISPTVSEIDCAINAAFDRIEARKAEFDRLAQEKEAMELRRQNARYLIAEELEALQEQIDARDRTINSLKKEVAELSNELEELKTDDDE